MKLLMTLPWLKRTETKRERIQRRLGLATDRERRDAVQAAQRVLRDTARAKSNT